MEAQVGERPCLHLVVEQIFKNAHATRYACCLFSFEEEQYVQAQLKSVDAADSYTQEIQVDGEHRKSELQRTGCEKEKASHAGKVSQQPRSH